MKKIGILTFHNSYNCGSMLETYAMYMRLKKIDSKAEIINFSSQGQKDLYNLYCKNNSVKNIIKNIIIAFHHKQISKNNDMYENFKNKYFSLSREYRNSNELNDDDYGLVVAGSDQIWNITIADYDDAYFLNFCQNARKVAYAPSFGSKRIIENTKNTEKFKEYINRFDAISIRENNGQKWIKDFTTRECPVLIDPTLLFDSEEYDKLLDDSCTPEKDYIFFYSPSFNKNMCKFVKKISQKYNMPVICWSTKNYYYKCVYSYGFKLTKCESPSIYLSLIKNASLIFTTSFHGTIFSTIYRKNFYVLKNGSMYGKDDRVITLLEQINMSERLIEPLYNENVNYMKNIDYSDYDKRIVMLREKANKYIYDNIEVYYE